ncbi:MAG: rod shape-determining protein MreD [Candidatus Marinimicrobia bacterium]|nr:rod shape-determining protein MreD [Candidatus Neomarinimicrobiota bacterium]
MIKIFNYALVLIFLFIFQLLFSDFLDINGIFPDLILIFIIYISFRIPAFILLWLAFFLGLMQDLIFSISLIGLSPLIKIIFAFLAIKLVNYHRSLNSIMLFILFSILITIGISFYDILSLFGVHSDSNLFYIYSFPKILYTLIIFIIVNFYYPLVNRQ